MGHGQRPGARRWVGQPIKSAFRGFGMLSHGVPQWCRELPGGRGRRRRVASEWLDLAHVGQLRRGEWWDGTSGGQGPRRASRDTSVFGSVYRWLHIRRTHLGGARLVFLW